MAKENAHQSRRKLTDKEGHPQHIWQNIIANLLDW
jgi:hypothetical protein